MYTLQIGREYYILAIYVDDILITSPDKKFLTRIKKKLMERFTMSDLGEVSLILGMKITRDRVKKTCLLYTSPSPRDRQKSRMPSSA